MSVFLHQICIWGTKTFLIHGHIHGEMVQQIKEKCSKENKYLLEKTNFVKFFTDFDDNNQNGIWKQAATG